MSRHLFLFRSTRDVIKAERELQINGIGQKVIPVPRTISSECGMALQIEPHDRQRGRDALMKAGIEVKEYHA